MRVSDTLSVCADCLEYLANGEGELEPNRVAEIKAGIEAQGGDVVPACAEDCEGGFSWSPCQLCGSALGGERHSAAVLVPDKRPLDAPDCESWAEAQGEI